MMSRFLNRFLSLFIAGVLVAGSVISINAASPPPSKRGRGNSPIVATQADLAAAAAAAGADAGPTPGLVTPAGAVRVTRLEAFQSPYYRQTDQQDPTNFCKLIINALNNNDLDTVKKLFIYFIKPIPYTVKMDTDTRFYLALFSSLFSSLYGLNPIETTDNIIKKQDRKCVITCIETDSTVYVLQYHIGEKLDQPLFTFNNTTNPDKALRVISLEHVPNKDPKHFTLDVVELKNNGRTPIPVTPATIEYKDDNFYKQMLDCFRVDSKRHLEKYLIPIYESIMPEWHILQEKFYQSIFYCVAKFFGNSSLMVEAPVEQGRTDVTVQTNRINIIEFKFEKDLVHKKTEDKYVAAAITQVKDRSYFDLFLGIEIPKMIFGVLINVNTKDDGSEKEIFDSIKSVTVGTEQFHDNPIPEFGFRRAMSITRRLQFDHGAAGAGAGAEV